MSHTHLTIEERCCLREYYIKWYSLMIQMKEYYN